MTEHFELTIKVKADANEVFKETEETVLTPEVVRLYTQILKMKSISESFIKINFTDQLLGEGFHDELREKIDLVPDNNLIQQAAAGLNEEDQRFFLRFGQTTEDEELKKKQDTVIQAILEQVAFTIEAVTFERVEAPQPV